MNEHFIKNIEIKNFKCFENFKAEGFGRVNLIGGKNNVGKTAFMEACYLNVVSDDAKDFLIASSTIILSRDSINLTNQQFNITTERHLFNHSQPMNIQINNNKNISFKLDKKNSIETNEIIKINNKEETIKRGEYKELSLDLLSSKNINFLPSGILHNEYLNYLHDEVRLKMKDTNLNNDISKIFDKNITKFLMKEKRPLIYDKATWKPLSEYGDGMKRFISTMCALYSAKDYLFIDEIENGIHYTNLDKLWEIILTISKEQNVQVFATTHSKECIESYARVAKKLNETDIKFLSLYKNKENKLKSITLDYQKIQDRIELGLDNR